MKWKKYLPGDNMSPVVLLEVKGRNSSMCSSMYPDVFSRNFCRFSWIYEVTMLPISATHLSWDWYGTFCNRNIFWLRVESLAREAVGLPICIVIRTVAVDM